MKDRITEKELKQPDAFQAQAASLVDFIFEYRSQVFVAIGATVLGIAIWVGISQYTSYRSRKAAQALHEAEQKFSQLPGEAAKDSAGWAARAEPALAALADVAEHFSGTLPGFEAALKSGDAYFQHGIYDKAATSYQLAMEHSPSRLMKTFAAYSLAYAQENMKNYSLAIETLGKALQWGEKSLKPEVLLSLARNYELSGNKAKATEYYTMVSTEFPNSSYSQLSDKQKSLAK